MIDDNAIDCFVDDLVVNCWVDDLGQTLCCAAIAGVTQLVAAAIWIDRRTGG